MAEQVSTGAVFAEEKLVYSYFFQHYVTSRLSQMPFRIIDIADVRLPTNSVLHLVDRLLEPDTYQIAPDLEAPLIKNESFVVQMKFITEIPADDDPLFPVTERYRFQLARINSQINNFFQHHMTVRPIRSSPQKVLAQSNNLVVFNYNPLRSVILNGAVRNADYRRFDLLLRSMLHQVAQIDNRHQVIHIPLSSHVYTQRQLTPCFHKLDVSTLRIHDDPSYFFLIHLLGLYADAETSLFRLLDQPHLDRITVVLTCQSKAILYNLGDLKAIAKNNAFYRNVLRHVTALKMTAQELMADMPAVLTDDQFDDIAGKMERDPTKTPMHTASDSITQPTTVLPTPVQTPPSAKQPPWHATHTEITAVTPAPTAAAPASNQSESPQLVESAVSVPHATVPSHQHVQPEHQSTGYAAHLVQSAINRAAQDPTLTDMQRQRIPALLDRHMAVTLHGRSLGEWLTAPPPPPINPTEGLEHLRDQLADPSMAASSIHHMDRHYLTHVMTRHLAATLSSLVSQGMFINHIEQHTERSQLNRIQHYKATMTDATGRQHSVTFRLPEVAQDGTMLVNGIASRMTKQPVNLPICKISPTRVNLASAYNKTLVERSTYKANNFTRYIHEYVDSLRQTKTLTATLGKSGGGGRLPYEYTCVSSGYARLETSGMVLTFDHAGRFEVAASAPAMEAVTDAGVIASARYATVGELIARGREKEHGVYIGYLRENEKATGQLFMGMDNVITVVRGRMDEGGDADTQTYERTTLVQLLQQQTGNVIPSPKMLTEWTELKILDRSFPLVFILGFHFGLTDTLQRIGLKYRTVPSGKRVSLGTTEIAVRFSDFTIVFDRYPITASLIACGLTRYDTQSYTMADFDNPDTYYRLLVDSDISANYLRGITSFFELFIDPITYDVLQRMGEPVTVRELLLRASEMLTDDHALEASAMANHRLRGYERFSALLYREISMTHARYSQQNGPRKGFSINPDAVFMSIVSDPTFSALDMINPVHDLKGQASITYAGAGGRTAQSFVVNDRRYPQDGVGVISEATVDSGKVAINAYTSVNPRLADELGMFTPAADVGTLTPTQVLSPAACLLPGVTQDEGRRAVMASIQLTHHVPSPNSEINRIRTGFEKVLPHLSGEIFACAAKEDGTVVSVDEKLGLIKLRYRPQPRVVSGKIVLGVSKVQTDYLRIGKSIYIIRSGSSAGQYIVGSVLDAGSEFNVRVGEIIRFKDLDQVPGVDRMDKTERFNLGLKLSLKQEESVLYIRLDPVSKMEDPVVEVYSFGESFTAVSGFHLRQDIRANVVGGDAVKKGDIIAYNAGFFAPEHGTKQVAWKQGVGAWVAFMELAATLEDSSVISPEFGKRMTMAPAHVRRVTIDKKTIVHQMVGVGDHVETTDLLCVVEDSDLLAGTLTDDPEDLAFLTELNRKAPRAKYHGRIAEVNVLYACDPLTMHPSLQTVLKKLLAPKVAKAQAVKDTSRPDLHLMPQRIPAGTKYGGIEFDEGTVVFEFTITEDLDAGQGDKIVINSANKSVIGSVVEKAPETESGIELDILFSGSSTYNRIITSIYVVGIGNRALIAAEKAAVSAYFD